MQEEKMTKKINCQKTVTRHHNLLFRSAAFLDNFARNTRGNIVIITALALPAMALGAGVAVDYSGIYAAKSDLQQMADAAAIAATREMMLVNKSETQTKTVAKNFVLANKLNKEKRFTLGIKVETVVDIKNNSLTINLSAARKNAFGGFLQPEFTTIGVTAKARVLAGTNVCAIGLDTKSKDTIKMDSNAALVANKCAIFSNSSNSGSINLKSNSSIEADLICSAGGIKISKTVLSTSTVTDCPIIDDPLINKVGLIVGACDHNNSTFKDKDITLSPGVYCGGIKVEGNSTVEFQPGIYVIKDGKLDIKGNTVANGLNVGFYFTGTGSRMKLDTATTISFVAPKSGIMVGMLFFQDPAAPDLPASNDDDDDDDDDDEEENEGKFEIKSNDARMLLGTIYLPKGILKVDTDNKVADDSAFTVVIAKRMEFMGNSKLVLNSDYSATDVPVPDGIANQNAKVYLAK